MGYQVTFHPDRGWQPATIFVNETKTAVEQQTRYQQIGEDEYLCVTVQRLASGFHKNPHVKDATIKRGLRPDGSFTESIYVSPTRIGLVADEAAPIDTRPTPPAERENAAQDYIARAGYALPEPRTSWAEQLHERGRH